jgi:hypothetical protein
MGPVSLFDKSFLQSLTVDESVWFDRFFLAVVCPIFYAETLADLAKEPSNAPTAEAVVRMIASKFPQMSGAPCASHSDLAIADLMGHPVSMNGRIPMRGGRFVNTGSRKGVVFDETPEAAAFGRWQEEKFQEVERMFARDWREALTTLDLKSVAKSLKTLGLDGKRVPNLEEAAKIARQVVSLPQFALEQLVLAVTTIGVPQYLNGQLWNRWNSSARPPLAVFAPYAAHVVTVEIFFQVALGASLISADRRSNRLDVGYLFYLPFSNLFISGDKLHRKCAPLFLRSDQAFAWGADLKTDLKKLNEYFLALPIKVRDKGIMSFAGAPPEDLNSMTARLWDQLMPNWRKRKKSAQSEIDNLAVARMVSKKKGSWWQLPKDYKE